VAHSSDQQRGIVLVLVLWLLVAMALVAGLVVAWSRERIASATADRVALQEHLDAIGSRDTLLYLAAIVPTTRAGLPLAPLRPAALADRRFDEFGGLDESPRGGELRLDGTVYAGLGGIHFQVQDEAGLVALNQPSGPGLIALLAAAGVPTTERASLIAALEDYADADDLRRFNGAESREYDREGLPPPSGRPLLISREVWRVFGWSSLSADARRRIEDLTTTAYAGALNLNTAPLPWLTALLPDCNRSCRIRLERRAEAPFLNAAAFEAETGTRLPGDRDVDFRTAPSDAWRLTLSGRSGRVWRIHVRSTPLADQAGPWTVEATYRLTRPPSDAAPLPIPSPLFAPAPVD